MRVVPKVQRMLSKNNYEVFQNNVPGIKLKQKFAVGK